MGRTVNKFITAADYRPLSTSWENIMFKSLALAAALAAVPPFAFAESFVMSVDVEDDDVNIALVIDANSDRPIMDFDRFVEINIKQHPWLAEADLSTHLPKGTSVDIEL